MIVLQTVSQMPMYVYCIVQSKSKSPFSLVFQFSELSDDDGVMAGHCYPGERSSHGQPAGSHDY